MKSSVLARLCLVLPMVLGFGCRSDEERCETLCAYFDKCEVFDSDCTESETEDCAETVEDVSAECRDAFEGLTGCLEDNEDDCEDAAENCEGDFDALADSCEALY